MDIQVFDENGKALHIADVISRFKFQLEVNAGRLAESLLNIKIGLIEILQRHG